MACAAYPLQLTAQAESDAMAAWQGACMAASAAVLPMVRGLMGWLTRER